MHIVWARRQTQGHGSQGRVWHSPEGGLYVTYCWGLPLECQELHRLAQWISLLVAEVLEEWIAAVRLKWPNDLLIQRKKVGGVLCEIHQVAGTQILLGGVGVNVAASRDTLAGIDQPATSLSAEGVLLHEHFVEELLWKIARKILAAWPLFVAEGIAPFEKEIKRREQI